MPFDLGIAGVGFWAGGVTDWPQAKTLLAGRQSWPAPGLGRAATDLMPANERRRAPECVLLALAVAQQACDDAGADPAGLPSVFASSYGDLAISDYMCATLREDPASLSPTRFHNSVHNAPSGYWSIATGATEPATSVAAGRYSVAAALLEAACQARERAGPVLLVAYDVAASGPLAEVSHSSRAFGCAFVLEGGEAASAPRLRLATAKRPAQAGPWPDPELSALADGNRMAAQALPVLDMLARGQAARLTLPLAPDLGLELELEPTP